MKNSIANPDSGMKLSCIALTDPFEAAVVDAAHSDDSIAPNRCSLPSILAPGPSNGLPATSAQWITASPARNITAIAAKIARPCLRSPAMRPNKKQNAMGISRIDRLCTVFDAMVGFSNGCAGLTPKSPRHWCQAA